MGTSASNGGPKGKSPLLPDWYDPEEQEQPSPKPDEGGDQKESEPLDQKGKNQKEKEQSKADAKSGNWSAGKSALTRFANGTGGASMKKAAKGYIRAMGGAKAATTAARIGVVTGGLFASFLGTASEQGFEAALTKLGVDGLAGKSSEEIMLQVSEALSPSGSTADEAVAREALIMTMDGIYDKLLEEGKDLSEISSFSPEMVNEVLVDYVSNYIFNKWMYELGIAIEKGDISIPNAIKLETEIQDYVKLEVSAACKDRKIDTLDLRAEKNQTVIKDILLTAYSTLEK